MSAVEQGGLWNEEREEKGRKEAEADICKEGRKDRKTAELAARDVSLRLFWLCCRSLLTHWHDRCSSACPVIADNRKRQKHEPKVASCITFTELMENYKCQKCRRV